MSEKHIIDGPYGPEWTHDHADGQRHVHPAHMDCDLGVATTELEQVKAVLDPVCRRRVRGSDVFGGVCSECNHTDFVHPGTPNPYLDACAICVMLAASNRVDLFIEEQRSV